MADTTFSAGTTITSNWLNDINDAHYNGVTVYAHAFGAVGDGTTDDTSALQAAFNYAKSLSGKKRLVLGPGKIYYISGTIGTTRSNTTDFADDLEVYGYGATLKINHAALPTIGSPGYSRFSSSTTMLNIEGNNVSVRGIKFTSTRTIDHTADPETYRDPLILGIVGGGKTTGIWDTTLSSSTHYKTGFTVEDCEFEYINSPIYVMHSGAVRVYNNKGTQWTETGIVFRDCSTDMWFENNNFAQGADDCVAFINYAAGPYGTSGTYAGRIFIRGNTLTNTFAKCIVVGGYSDVEISDNYTDLSAGGNIVLESGAPWASNRIFNQRCKIYNNIVRRGGRYYSTSFSYAGHQSPVAGQEHGIHTLRNNDRSVQPNVWQYVQVSNNLVENPRAYGVAFKSTDYVFAYNNTIVSDTYDHGAGAIGPSGQPVWSDDIRTFEVKDNKYLKNAASTWSNTYHIGNTNIVSGEVRIQDNVDYTGLNESFDGSAGTATQAQIRFQWFKARYELRFDRSDDGQLIALSGNGGNLQAFCTSADNEVRIWNSGGSKHLRLGMDNSNNPQGAVGLPVMTTAQRDAMTNVQNGQLIYNSTVPAIQARVGGAWVGL